MIMRRLFTSGNVTLVAVVVVLLVLPSFSTSFFMGFVMTRTLMLGLAAATIVVLSAYGGMVSLAQLLMFGIAGFTFGNLALEAGARGLSLGWPPWVAVMFALLFTTVIAFVLGAVASRTTGIYFLMLTLVYGVIGYYVFAQVVPISGPGGVTSIRPPPLLASGIRLYYAALMLSVLAYVGFRLLGSSPFGVALQGVRDDPLRMASLGLNVPLHRTLAFTLAGFVAGLAGLLNVWWNGQIDPASISTGPTLVLLIIAVIGGISHLEGAWLGAFVYVVASNYLRELPLVDRIGITPDRFNTIVGAIVLMIMVLSPEGLMGVIERLGGRLRRRGAPPGGGSATHRTPADGSGPVGREPAVWPTTGDAPVTTKRGNRPMRARDKHSPWLLLVSMLTVLALLAAACGGADEGPATPAEQEQAQDEPAAGGDEEAATDAGGEDPVRLGILGECEGPFGGFHEDTVAGVALAMANFAGAEVNSDTTALDGWENAQVNGRPIELVGVGCGDDTPDTIIGEVRQLVEQENASIVIGPL
jgi:branched-chain amino acid transport system permease protein